MSGGESAAWTWTAKAATVAASASAGGLTTLNGNVTAGGNVSFAGGGAGAVALGGNVAIDAGTGTVTLGAMTGGASNFTVTANDVALSGNWTVPQRLQDVLYELVGVYGPVEWASEARGDFYHLLTSALGAFTLVVTIYVFLRSAQPRARLAAADAVKIRALLDKHGDRDSLGYFALRADKLLHWAPSGKAAVAYRVINGVSLASGDPVGVPSQWPDAIGQWLGDCARHGWTPAVGERSTWLQLRAALRTPSLSRIPDGTGESGTDIANRAMMVQ